LTGQTVCSGLGEDSLLSSYHAYAPMVTWWLLGTFIDHMPKTVNKRLGFRKLSNMRFLLLANPVEESTVCSLL
jgi:hypothetical protein